MKRDDAHARAVLEGDPYGVPTGGVPRVRQTVNLPNTGATVPISAEAAATLMRDWPTDAMCKHGFIPPENCADCNQMGVTQVHRYELGVCPHGVPPDKCADCSEDSIHAVVKPGKAGVYQIGGDHYAKLTIQPWDAMAEWMTPEQFSGFLCGNVIKYLARHKDKGGVEDLRKARHYLDKLIEVSE